MVGKSNVGLLSCAAAVMLAAVLPRMSPAVPVSIDKATTFQTMEGMGAMNRITGWKVRQGPFYIDHPLTNFYDSLVNVMGFTIIRPAPELCAFSPSAGVYSVAALRSEYTHVLALMAVAARNGEPFWAMPSVFSPPAYQKNNNQCPGAGEGTYATDATNSLRTDSYAAYGDVVAAYLRLLKDSLGITAKAVSLQNEPSFNEPYASCSYSGGTHYAQMLRAAGPRVRALGYPTLIYGVEHMAWAYPSWENAILSDAQAAPYMDRFAVHGYSDGVRVDTSTFDTITATGGKPLWMTETGGPCETYADGMAIARQIMKAFVQGSMSSWQFCGLIGLASSCGWLVSSDNGAPNPAYWAHAHFARFARPGMKRIAASCTDGELLVAAFADDSKSSISVVAINTNASAAKTMTLSLTGGSLPAQFETRTTSATANFASGTVAGTGSVTVPANGIVSLGFNHRGTPVAVRGQTAAKVRPAVSATRIDTRRFDLRGALVDASSIASHSGILVSRANGAARSKVTVR